MTSVVLITGAMAAGKSTVAQLLAERLPAAAHVRGDLFRRMIVRGQASMAPPLSADGRAQLELRHELAAEVAVRYARAGIVAVVQDLYLGDDLPRMVARLAAVPTRVFVLAPRPSVLAERDGSRGKRGYVGWSPDDFDRELRERTPRLGHWLDSSELTPAETVELMLAAWDEARVASPADSAAP